MPSVTLPIGPDGPLIQLVVGVSSPRRAALTLANIAVPSPQVIFGLIDTGASCTVVDRDVIKRLGIDPTGTVPMHTASTGSAPETANQYDVSIFLMMEKGHVHASSFILPIVESNFSTQPFDCLIGRDILEKAHMTYSGPARTITLNF